MPTCSASLAVLLPAFAALVVNAAEPFPFTVAAVATPGTGRSAIDLSHLNAEPAGSHGFLRISGAHFVDDRGGRIRLFGTNLTDFHTQPDAATAVTVARRLRQLGINVVRLHYADWYRAPEGLCVSPGSDDLDPGQLDRLHRFIAELVGQGVWVNLNLHVARHYPQAPEWADKGKWIDRIHPLLLDSQRAYARNLLTPVNPYTGRRLADEPGLCAIELNNENTALHLPLNRLAELPAAMQDPLRLVWNRWLAQRHGSTDRLRTAWKVEASRVADGLLEAQLVPLPGSPDSPCPSAEALAFLAETEIAASTRLKRFLRDELGCRQPIIDTQISYGGGAGVVRSLAVDDYSDMHGYPANPEYLGQDAKRQPIWGIPDSNLFDRPRSELEGFAFLRVADRPFVVSEWDVNPPNQGAGLGLPALVALASLQDWDGLYDYCWLGWSPTEWNPDHLIQPFCTVGHAPQMVTLPAMAIAFRSGLIEAAREVVGIPFTASRHGMPALAFDGSQAFTGGAVALDGAWRHRLELRPGESTAPLVAIPAQDTTDSDTGQVRIRRQAAGSDLRVIAPGLRWLAGAIGGQEHVLGDVIVDCRNLGEPTATITCTALDGRTIRDSNQVLITTAAGAANADLQREAGGRITTFGTGPALNQPVTITLRLPGSGWTLSALDGEGVAGTTITAQVDGWHLGTQRTLWYLASRGR